MSEQRGSGNGEVRPAYLDSLVGTALADDRRCLDWKGDFPYLRDFVLGGSNGLSDTGTRFGVAGGLQGLSVVLQTLRYGYDATYEGCDLPSILEQMNNDLDCGTVPWKPDWRRKRENSKRLEL